MTSLCFGIAWIGFNGWLAAALTWRRHVSPAWTCMSFALYLLVVAFLFTLT